MVDVKLVLQVLVYLSSLVGMLPLIPFVNSWILALFGLGFILGICGDYNGRSLLGNRLATLLAGGFFLHFFIQVSLTNLVVPLVNLLSLLLALRLAGEKSPRHILQLFLLATIVLAASSMLTLNLAYLFCLILIILFVTAGLVLLSFYASAPQLSFSRRYWVLLIKTIAILPAASLILMLALFVILPRTQTPLWNFLNPESTAKTGMSDQVKPGTVTDLATNEQLAFRVETERLEPDALYWRGIVFNKLDGQTWQRSDGIPEEDIITAPESEIELTFYSEPKVNRYLVTLDRPVEVKSIRHNQSPDSVIEGRFQDNRSISYKVRAQYQARSRQVDNGSDYLALPQNLSARLLSVADRIKAGDSFSSKRELLDRFFLQQGLSYSASRLPQTEQAVDSFLFDSRRGYCEYFASSYALLLRMAGIPSRLVGGYLGGAFNQIGGYYLVYESSAHVWVEALDDAGIWQRIDPSRLAINSDEAFTLNRQQGISTLGAMVDAAVHGWSRFVLNYDLHRQIGVFRNLTRQARQLKQLDPKSLKPMLWLLPGLLPLVVWYLWMRRQSRHLRVMKKYRLLMAHVAGLESLSPDVGIFEIAELSGHPLCQKFADIYGEAVYQDRALDDSEYRQIRHIVRNLKHQSAAIEFKLQ